MKIQVMHLARPNKVHPLRFKRQHRTLTWLVNGFLILAAMGWQVPAQVSNPEDPMEDPRYVVRTIAGSLLPGYGGDGGPSEQAALNWPRGVDTDDMGNIYIADSENCRIRKIDAEGMISTIAGNGLCGAGAEGLSALNSPLDKPTDVAVNALGEVFFTEGSRIRKLNTSGVITTVAGVPPQQQPECSDQDDAPALFACLRPRYLDLAPNGTIFFSDGFLPDRVRSVNTLGIVTTVAGVFGVGFSGDGGLARVARLNSPQGVAYHDGNLYIADELNYRIRRVDSLGIIRTIAGTGELGGLPNDEPALEANVSPLDLWVDELNKRLLFTNTSTGSILALDEDDRIQVVIGPADTEELPDILAENTPDRETRVRTPRGVAVDPITGDILYSEGNPATIAFPPSNEDPTLTAAARIRRGILGGQICQIPFPGDSTGTVGTPFLKTIPYISEMVESFTIQGLPPGLMARASRIEQEIIIDGIPTMAGEFEVTLTLGCGARTTFSITISAAACLFSTESPLPIGRVGILYSQQLLYQAVGTQSISLVSGALPPGLLLVAPPAESDDLTWRLQGTPLQAGAYSFVLRLNPCGEEKLFEIEIDAAGCVFITESPLPTGQIGVAYSTTILYSGTGQQSMSVVAGSLPPGILLVAPPPGINNPTWRLEGTPTQAGAFLFTLALSPCGAMQQYQLVIAAETLLISTPALPPATVGCLYETQLAASGGLAPYAFRIPSGMLPPGLVFSANGVLSGTPTQAGSGNIGFEVIDALEARAQKSMNLSIAEALTWLTTSLPSGTVGQSYPGLTLQVSGGNPPLTFSVVNPLPAGLMLSSAGLLSGTPTATFNGNVTLRVSAGGNCSAETTLPLLIGAAEPEQIEVRSEVSAIELRNEYEVSVNTDRPPLNSIAGNLALQFASLAEQGRDNPEVAFATDPRSRSANFTVNTNETFGRFLGGSSIRFNSGTVAGTITLVATMNTSTGLLRDTLEFVVPPTPPRLVSMTLARSGNTVTITATGYAPRRRITNGTLELVPRAGVALSGPASISLAQLSGAFNTYFEGEASRAFGSQFVLTIPLTISGGSAADLAEVRLTLVGDAGENSNVLTAQ